MSKCWVEETRDDGTTRYVYKVERKIGKELEQLVRDIMSSSVFVGNSVPTNLLPTVFMPIGFGCFDMPGEVVEKSRLFEVDSDDDIATIRADWLRNVGALYEYMDKAAPRSINGYPCFFSCEVLHTDDWKRVHAAVACYTRTQGEISMSLRDNGFAIVDNIIYNPYVEALQEAADGLDEHFPGTRAARETREIVTMLERIAKLGQDDSPLSGIWYAMYKDLNNNNYRFEGAYSQAARAVKAHEESEDGEADPR